MFSWHTHPGSSPLWHSQNCFWDRSVLTEYVPDNRRNYDKLLIWMLVIKAWCPGLYICVLKRQICGGFYITDACEHDSSIFESCQHGNETSWTDLIMWMTHIAVWYQPIHRKCWDNSVWQHPPNPQNTQSALSLYSGPEWGGCLKPAQPLMLSHTHTHRLYTWVCVYLFVSQS